MSANSRTAFRLLVAAALVSSTAVAARGQLAEPAPRADEIRPLLVGAEVPSVVVQTVEGESLDLRDRLEGKPTLLIFYRGGW